MPGAYPRTSTMALTNATLPYVVCLAGSGMDEFTLDPGFAKGVNTFNGYICYQPVAQALGETDRYRPLAELY